MNEQKRTTPLLWPPVLAALVTSFSVIFAVVTYTRGVHEQRQAAAIGILQEYLKLSVDHPDLASRDSSEPVDAKYGWFATHALFTAETLWTLVGSDDKWQNTITFVLRQHRGYLEAGVLSCDAFQAEFVEYMKARIPELKCDR